MLSLHEFTKDEWRDICRKIRPEWEDDRFEEYWADFVELKRRKELH